MSRHDGFQRSAMIEADDVLAGLEEPQLAYLPQEVDELEQSVLDFLTTLRTVGGVFQVAAIRKQVGVDPFGDPIYVPQRYVVQYNSFVPADKPPDSNGQAEMPAPAAVADEQPARETVEQVE